MTIVAGAADCASGLAQRIFQNLTYDSKWVANQAGYGVGARGCPTTPNGFGYQVQAITTGVTGSSEPTWPLVINNTVVDGGVTWKCTETANPTGRLQSVNPGYVMSTADLDGFRLLAWNTAKAVIDEVNANKVDLASQASSSLGGSVALQASTPGTQQTGHSNISGTAIVGGSISVGTASTGGIVQEAWTAVGSFLNSWVNFGAPYASAAYFKDTLGVIHLQGMIKSGTMSTAAFTLPAGYRPSANKRLICESNGTFGLIIVDSSGNVTPSLGSNAWVVLEGITFDTR